MSTSISLNKFISDTGYCSRRQADQLIEEGRVLINGALAVLGNRYTTGDEVEVDGSIIKPAAKEKSVYIMLNKPVGITTTSEQHVPGNIVGFVNHNKRLFPVGRLDKDSEGLIFLTNDGDIVNKILRAGNSHEKEYIVRLRQPAEKGFVSKMSSGVRLLGTVTKPCKVEMINRHTFRIVLTQGMNRQIRRMVEALGNSVSTLQRVRIMNIELGPLALGKWRYMTEPEVAQLKALVSASDKTAKASPRTFIPQAAPSKKVYRRESTKTHDGPEKKAAKPQGAKKKKAVSYKDYRKGAKGK